MTERWFTYSDVDGGALIGVVGREDEPAFACLQTDGTGDFMRRADLIAAAPEMLELLRESIAFIDDHKHARYIRELLARIDGNPCTTSSRSPGSTTRGLVFACSSDAGTRSTTTFLPTKTGTPISPITTTSGRTARARHVGSRPPSRLRW